jgi:hypothetical protein
MIPGSNILAQALTMIASQAITWLSYQSRSTNDIGMQVSVYAAPVTIQGSIQAVPRTLIQALGLDMNKTYVNIFVPNNVIDIERDITSDQFQYGGATYQGLYATPWFSIDGWNQILAVQVPSAG